MRFALAAMAGDRGKAELINTPLLDLHSTLFVEANPVPVKWLMHKMGYGSDALRLPLVPLANKYYAIVTDAARKGGIDI